MIFRQVIQEDLGCASYFVGDEHAGRAAVVDPRFDVDVYLELALQYGVEITDILETHTHADHISGHGRLAELTGAAIHVNEEAQAGYPHKPLRDGSEVVLGDVVIRARHLPGHRPEHTGFVLVDRARGSEPWAVLSGDSLLVGDVARPDLAVGGEEGAGLLHDALAALLEELPAETELWPGHVGGSTCGSGAIDMKTSSTLGYECVHNPVLRLRHDEFVSEVNSGLGERPANFEAIVEANRGPLSAATSEPAAVDAGAARSLLDRGAIAVDVRRAIDFDAAHIPGAVSFPAVRPGFAGALAEAIGGDRELLFVGTDETGARRASRLTESVGLSRVSAVLAGGMSAWEAAGLPTQAIETVPAAELGARVEAGDLQVIDIRDPETFAKGSLPGAVSAVYTDLAEVPDGIDPSRPIAVVCTTGKRAGIGAGLLRHAGAERVIHVTHGGVAEVRPPRHPA